MFNHNCYIYVHFEAFLDILFYVLLCVSEDFNLVIKSHSVII